ncbi:MAG: hypothetical protein QFX35_02685 [Candidatus Verstraetearchaeota archaeon]|nr:hypothetical protein [Candidatus Verstraetearchaeota archaeon]
MDKKTLAASAVLAVVVCAALMGGVLATQAFSSTRVEDSAGATTDLTTLNNRCFGCRQAGGNLGLSKMRGHGAPSAGCIEVSEEYKATVVGIAQNDSDVQDLLADGYNITSVHPIIRTTLDAEGYVTSRATTAVLNLQKDENNSASVWVDVVNGAVTKIVISSRTVIDKS